MGSLNKAMLIGNLGKDAELRYTPAGAAVSTFSMATTETWTDKEGQKQEKTEWHRVVLWGKQAEAVSQYLVKGKQVYVEGQLQTRSWDDKETGQKKYMTEVKANRVTLLGGGGGGGSRAAGRGSSADDPPMDPITDDEIPFAWLLPIVWAFGSGFIA